MTFVDKTQKAAAASTSATDRKAVVQELLHEQAATAFPTEPVRRGERRSTRAIQVDATAGARAPVANKQSLNRIKTVEARRMRHRESRVDLQTLRLHRDRRREAPTAQ